MPRSLVHGAGHARWLPGAALAAVILTVMSACSDRLPTAARPLDPAFVISDGAHDGNAHFFFLPPLVSQPSVSGMEDGSLSPTVDACDIGTAAPVTDAPCLGASVASFSTTSGTASELVRYTASGKKYSVDWHTDRSSPALQTGHYYRVSVRVAGTLLGFLDVVPLANGAQLKNYRTGDIIALVNGRTLPIAFRIEQGAVAAIGSTGGTAVLNDGAVKLVFPPAAVAGDVGVTATPLPVGDDGTDTSILPGTLYEFQPSPTTFSTPVALTLTYPAALPPHTHADRLALCKMVDGACRPIAGSRVDPATRTVTAEITSFSEYSITEWPEMLRGLYDPIAGRWNTSLYTANGNVSIVAGLDVGWAGWSPDGQRVALVRYLNGWPDYDRDIQVVNADGSGAVTILSSGAYSEVSWSPIGEKLLFMDGGAINVMQSDGSGRIEVGASSWVPDPAWSPDGQRVAYFGDCSPAQFNLCVVNADGTGLHLVISDFSPASYGEGPKWAWSPDGEEMAFIDGGGLWVVKLDGTGRRLVRARMLYPLQNDVLEVTNMSWSPAGDGVILFSLSGVDVPALTEIHTIHSDGSGERTLVHSEDFNLWFNRWSPDGRRIAFRCGVVGGICLINADGTGFQPLDETDVPVGHYFFWRP